MKQLVDIKVNGLSITGELTLPENATGLVIFSHGSGSSRFSPRNTFVARQLQHRGLGTFLFDLLTREEEEVYSMRFNINLLAQRLVQVTQWLLKFPPVNKLPIGYFGASTGAASALVAASLLQNKITAIVSRGGRPDLAKDQLPLISAPTLLIVGELDLQVLALNRTAFKCIAGIKELKIIKGATHLFEEKGTLEEVAIVAGDWFVHYLTGKTSIHFKERFLS